MVQFLEESIYTYLLRQYHSSMLVQCSFTLTPNMVIFEKIAPVRTIFSHLVIIHGLIFFLVHYKVL